MGKPADGEQRLLPHSPRRAFNLFQSAANQGYVESQFALGVCYLEGIGTRSVDLELACSWTHLASQAGHARAMEVAPKACARAREAAGR